METPRVARTFTLVAISSVTGILAACGGASEAPSGAAPNAASAPAPSDVGKAPATTTALGATLRSVGQACAFGAQCASGGCSANVTAGACGTCLDVRPLGARCDGPAQGCSPSAICQDGRCVSTRKTLGQTCHLGGKGDSGECDDELFCLGPSGGDGTCVARSTLGGACSQPFRGCAGNADCERGVCVTPRLGALGDTCDQRRCGEGLVCGNEYTCQPGAQPARDPGTLRAEGQTCWGYAAFSDCVDGLECRNETCMRACR